MSKMRLGYKFYPKDWRSSDAVYGLTLQEKGFYRELIDECFIEGSEKITINVRSFTRKHGINARTYSKLIQNLCKTSLIVLENNCETSLYVPSVCSRLGVISRARNGGIANAKKSAERGAEEGANTNTNTNTKVEVEVKEKTTTTNPPKRLDVFNYQTDRDKISSLIKNDKTKLLVYRNCKGFKMTDENYNTLINTFLDFKAGTVFNHTNINDILSNFVLWTPSELKRLREAKTDKK